MHMFGRVAKGVGGVLMGGRDNVESQLEALLHQISESRHAGDRRDGMSQLRDLVQDSPQAQEALGTMGLHVLLGVLRDQQDRDDSELLARTTETLLAALALPEGALGGPLQEGPPPPGLLVADLLLASPEALPLLLTLLEPEPVGVADTLVRYNVLAVLGALAAAAPDRVQAQVQECPGSLVALLDLLAPGAPEVLRNEALLLLGTLARGCPPLAQLLAFEGAFDRLLGLVGGEGGLAGGSVLVQDALEVANHLLRAGAACRRLFRDMGHLQQLPPLLHYTPPPPSTLLPPGATPPGALGGAVGAAAAAAAASLSSPAPLPPQVAANYLCALELVRLLLAAPARPAADTAPSEAAERLAAAQGLGHLGLMGVLIGLAVSGEAVPQTLVRAQGLLCLADWTSDHPAAQEAVGSAGVVLAGGTGLPLLHAVLRLALSAGDGRERAGAAALVAAFCRGNPEGQLTLVSTMAPDMAGGPGGTPTWGQELAAALLGSSSSSGVTRPEDWVVAGRGVALLGALVEGNAAAQQRLVGVPLTGGQGGGLLMARCLALLRDGSASGSEAGVAAAGAALRLLVVWCAGCGAAVVELLGRPAQEVVALLVQGAQGGLAGGDVHITGLCALLLGVCFSGAPSRHAPAHPSHPAAITREALLDVLLRQLGLSSFNSALDALTTSPEFKAAAGGPRQPAHMSRAAVGALLAADQGEAPPPFPPPPSSAAAAGANGALAGFAGVGGGGNPTSGDSPGRWGLPGLGPVPPGGTWAGSPGPLNQALYDYTFATSLLQLAASVKQLALAGVTAGPAAALPAPPLGPVPPPSTTTSSSSAPPPVASGPIPFLHRPGVGGGGGPTPPSSLIPPPPGHLIPPPPGGAPPSGPPLWLPTAPGTAAAAAAGAGSATSSPLSGRRRSSITSSAPPPPAGAASAAAAAPLGPPPVPWLPGQPTSNGNNSTGSPHAAAALGTDFHHHHQQQQHQPSPLGFETLPNGTPTDFHHHHHQQQQPALPPSSATAATSSHDAAAAAATIAALQQQLGAAQSSSAALAAEVEELRSRNHALAADLLRLGSGGAGGPGGEGGAGGSDDDARRALQLRASRAEMEVGALKQQLASLTSRWDDLEAQVASAQAAAEAAGSATSKAEADLGELSAAYNALEAHAAELEGQLEAAQAAAAAAAAGQEAQGNSARLDEAEVAARVEAAVAEVRQQLEQQYQQQLQQQNQQPPAPDPGPDLAAAVEAAVAEARAAAAAESDEAMEDLLACLGEYELKVEVLSSALAAHGEDVEQLLASCVAADEDEDGGPAADDSLR